MPQYINIIEANLGEKIMLIKMVRRMWHLGLKESKDLVERVSDAIVACYGTNSITLDAYMLYLDYAADLEFGNDPEGALKKITAPFSDSGLTNVYRAIFIAWLRTWQTKVR